MSETKQVDAIEREFAEYVRLARVRIPFVANGYQHALDAYRQERERPTPLMLEARAAISRATGGK